MIYVYALTTPAPGGLTARGVAGERLRTVTFGSITAVVGEVARLPRPTEANLRAFDRAIQTVLPRAAALLPTRFGTHVRDLGELAAIIDSRRDSLQRRLTAVRRRAQMTVRMWEGPGVRGQGSGGRGQGSGGRGQGSGIRGKGAGGSGKRAGKGEPGSGQLTRGHAPSGQDYLRVRAAALAREQALPSFRPLRDAVRRWVRDERVEKGGSVATVYHLVPRGSVAAYRRAVERAARKSGVRVLVTGPWPAYAFADPLLM